MRPAEINENLLCDLYVNLELTAKECALILGTNPNSVCRRLRKLGIPVRPPIRRLITNIDDTQVIDLYCNQKLSRIETARVLGRSEGFVRGRLEKNGIEIRSLSDSARERRGTADITDEQLIFLHDVRKWSCAKISEHFNKSADFVRQRFIAIGKERRDKIGKNNPAYIDGRTPLRTRIRDCAKSLAWKQACLERDNYTCQKTGQRGGKLEVHHIKLFSIILEEFLFLNSDLDPVNDCDSLFDISQRYDPFWNTDNGLTLSEEFHKTTHS